MSSNENQVVNKLVEMGVAKVVDGLSTSRESIIKIVSKEKITEDEKTDLLFHINIFLSCVD